MDGSEIIVFETGRYGIVRLTNTGAGRVSQRVVPRRESLTLKILSTKSLVN